MVNPTKTLLLVLPLILQTTAQKTRILAIGDSITASWCSYRAYLWQRLNTAGYASQVDFVGSQGAGGGCNFPFDSEHEAVGGSSAIQVANQGTMRTWMRNGQADIVLMHFGTNDMFSGYPTPEPVLNAYTTILSQARETNPNVKFIVQQIIPMACCNDRVKQLNAAIPAWASANSRSNSPITVVDNWTGFDLNAYTGDGVHPNEAGSQVMAAAWSPAVVAALGGSTPVTTTRPPTTTTTTRVISTTTTTTTTVRPTTTTTTTRTTTTTTRAPQTGAPLWGQCGGQGKHHSISNSQQRHKKSNP